MMIHRYLFLLGAVAALLLFLGCNKTANDKDDHNHAEHSPDHGKHSNETSEHAHDHENDHDENESGVSYKEGHGLEFSPEVIHALAIKTAKVEEASFSAETQLSAQIYATTPRCLASARVPEANAALLENASFNGAKLLRVDRSASSATRLVDLVFELEPSSPNASSAQEIGDFVTLTALAKPRSVLTAPKSAVLDSAQGTFVYVVNDDAYLRTPVTIGARSSDYIEITKGLSTGTLIIVAPVEQLWLAELRLTKGGGHSH